jgi:hypothetical protein
LPILRRFLFLIHLRLSLNRRLLSLNRRLSNLKHP